MEDELLPFLGVREIQELYQKKKISPSELTEIFLKRIEALNPLLNAFLYINSNEAREQAKQAEKLLQQRHPNTTKPLLGIPITIPDPMSLKGTPSTYGSLLLKNHIAQEDAFEVKLLKEAGAIILGKTNMSEFGIGQATINRLANPCRNPCHPDYSPGGPSAGAAVAVAAGLTPWAVGVDYGGSLRIASGFCGLIGLKPTRDKMPLIYQHLLPLTERMFFQKGPVTRNVFDASLLLNVIANSRSHLPSYHSTISQNAKFRIVHFIPHHEIHLDLSIKDYVQEVSEKLRRIGHSIEKKKTLWDQDLYIHFRNISAVDRCIMLTQLEESQPLFSDLITPYTKQWLSLGNQVSGVQYSYAETYIYWLRKQFDILFETCDFILLPTTPIPPYLINESSQVLEQTSLDPLVGLFSYTCPLSMVGYPTIAIPSGHDKKGMPQSIQLVGKPFHEDYLFAFANSLQSTLK